MLAAAIRQRHDCKSVASAPFAADAPLTDPDTASRPAPNENHLLINAYTTHPRSPLLAVTRRISDSGCNLVDTRLSTVGRDVSVTALATGSWDAVAKLEAMLTRLEREEGLKLVWYRTGPKQVAVEPAAIRRRSGRRGQAGHPVPARRLLRPPGHHHRKPALLALPRDADRRGHVLRAGHDRDSGRHAHRALRDDFLEFCDHLNLDAIMDPMKF
jgi:glycine cleavage system transcriptional repressor